MARETETGDRAEIEDLPEDLPFWNDIAATSENCIGAECPRYHDCFVTRMRQRAAESDVVIVNHHLLCADAAVRQSAFGEVIPVLPLRDRRRGAPARGRRDAVLRPRRQQLPGRRPGPRRRPRRRRRADRRTARRRASCRATPSACATTRADVRDAADAALRGAGQREHRRRRARPHPSCATRRGWPTRAWRSSRALEALEADIALAQGRAGGRARAGAPRRRAARDVRFLLRADDPDYVYYLDIRGRGVFLRASPIDVSDIVREMLLDRMKAPVLTSATLTVTDRSTTCAAGSASATRTKCGCLRVRLRAAGDSLPAAQDARSRGRRSSPRPRRARSSRSSSARTGARSCSSRATRTCARSARSPGGTRVSDPRAGHRAAVGAAARLQGDAATPCCSRRPASGRASTSSARR